MSWWDKYIEAGVGNCLLVTSPDGKTSNDPCGGAWCSVLNAYDWLNAAEGYINKAEAVAETREQQNVTQNLRREVGNLRESLGWSVDYGGFVHRAVALSQKANCAWAVAAKPAPTPTPQPVPDENGGWSWPTWPGGGSLWPGDWTWPTLPTMPGMGFGELAKYWPIALLIGLYYISENPASKRVRGK